MGETDRKHVHFAVGGLTAGLLFMGALRYSSVHDTALTPLSGLATPGYVVVTIFFALALQRAGVSLNRFGFGGGIRGRHLLLALAAFAALRLSAMFVSPWIESMLGGERDLARFSDVQGSLPALLSLLALNWTFAAFGEEIAYRIVLMRGLAHAFGDTPGALTLALLVQAAIFGLVHAYQGPAGILGSAVSALIFGAITLAARWSIWPAALAHGANNTIGIFELYRG